MPFVQVRASETAQPVASPLRARDLVRDLVAGGLGEPVEVIFAAGTCTMGAALELRPEDSGTEACPITWKAAAGATVVLDGGKPLSGTWTNGGGGIWYIDLAGVGLGAGQWNFRQLFVNGSRATRARFPNKSEANPFLYATGGAFDHAIIAPARIKTAWGTAADAQINIVPQSRFFNQWNTVAAVNTSTVMVGSTSPTASATAASTAGVGSGSKAFRRNSMNPASGFSTRRVAGSTTCRSRGWIRTPWKSSRPSSTGSSTRRAM